jgi:hypothetical protein
MYGFELMLYDCQLRASRISDSFAVIKAGRAKPGHSHTWNEILESGFVIH